MSETCFFISGVQREFSYIGPLNSFVFFDSLCLSVSLASDVHTIAGQTFEWDENRANREKRGALCKKRKNCQKCDLFSEI